MEELDFEVNDREDDGIMDHLLIGREATEKKIWWQKKEIENNQGVKDDALELPPFTSQITTSNFLSFCRCITTVVSTQMFSIMMQAPTHITIPMFDNWQNWQGPKMIPLVGASYILFGAML